MAGAVQSDQDAELPDRLVEPLRMPQQGRQHEACLQVATVSTQQLAQDSLGLEPVSFQIFIACLGEKVSFGAVGPVFLAVARPKGDSRRHAPSDSQKHPTDNTQVGGDHVGPDASAQQQAVHQRGGPEGHPQRGPTPPADQLRQSRPKIDRPRHPAHRRWFLPAAGCGSAPDQPSNCSFEKRLNQGS